MATVHARIAFLEGQVERDGQMITGLNESIMMLDQRVVMLDHRVTMLDEKFDRRLEALDRKIDRNTDRLDAKMSRHFLWLVGIQVTMFVVVVTALVAR